MTEIIIGASAPDFGSGQYQLFNDGPGFIRVETTGTIFGFTAQHGPDSGAWTLEPVTPFVAGPFSGGAYPASGIENIEVVFATGKLHGTIDWMSLTDGLSPRLDGDMMVTLSTGSLLGDFPLGSHAAIDVITGTLDVPLSAVVEWGYPNVLSGQIVPGGVPVPEPAMFVLLALALGWTFLLRKLI